MRRALTLTLLLGAVAAHAECATDCEQTLNQCIKGCFANTQCRRDCEKTSLACTTECGAGLLKTKQHNVNQLETDCGGGEPKACFVLGQMYFIGKELALDYDRAAKYLQAACRDSQADACGLLGEMYLRPFGVAQDVARGLSLMERSCDRNSVEGCTVLGRVLYEGKNKPRDIDRAMKLWKDACGKDHGAACTLLGTAHLEVKKEPALALEKFDRACVLADGPGCAAACLVLQGGQGVPRDEKRAYTLCEKGCADGQMVACTKQGMLLWYAEAVKPDAKKGADLIDAACEGGDAAACVELAQAAAVGGHGMKKDAEAAATGYLRATRRYEKHCNERLDVNPCGHWATLVAIGKTPNKDPIRTRALLEKGCTGEETVACAGLGRLLEDAKEGPKAFEAYLRACNATDGAACLSAARLVEFAPAATTDGGTDAGSSEPPRARALIERGCTFWSGDACLKLADLLKAEKAPVKDQKALRAKACRYGLPEACR